MGRRIELSTENKLEYKFYPNKSGCFEFQIRAPHDAHIALCSQAVESDPMYEVFIGGWKNTKSVIRKNRTKPDVAEVSTPGILNANEFRAFWIRWSNGTITVGRKGQGAILIWRDSAMVPINYVGVCTGWGASGKWIFEESSPLVTAFGEIRRGVIQPSNRNLFNFQQTRTASVLSRCSSATAAWAPASGGYVPSNAFIGGQENGESMYVIRAHFRGGLIPGKLLSSHGVGYVPWGGTENPVNNYEVLTDFRGRWVSSSLNNIPANAFAAGRSEDGETLYIGRVDNGSAFIIGKVQASHKVCYIPYGGQEIAYNNYEILIK